MSRKPKPDHPPLVIRQLVQKRMASGLSRRQMADRLGYSLDTVNLWETGRVHPSFQSLMNWCQFFGVTLRIE